MSDSYIVIPARLHSTRLPRKLLLRETGKTLIEHTFDAARRAKEPRAVCIATDSEEIATEARQFGAQVYMTDPACTSGTDRIAQVAPLLPHAEIIVNVQGDEPQLRGEDIDLAVRLLDDCPTAQMATLATPIRDRDQLNDPACVKVVFSAQSKRALYFSRSPIPHAREWREELLTAEPPCFYQHIGLYAYRRDFLLTLARLPRTPLETLENLEQLRALENGYDILVGVVSEPTIGIDTPADYRAFVERMNAA